MTRSACGYRLPSGGLIDRSRELSFTFNGRSLKGHPGDTLASALIANGINIVGRSFKYHRPRGLYGVGVEDPNSMLAITDRYGYDPALRAGQVRLCEGLDARSVTGWPSASFDLAAGVQLFSKVVSAGFYYKTFKWPSWAFFEPFIERSTGFGRPRLTAEARTSHHRHSTCDVLIIGGGPAGLATARSLVGSGLSVVLANEQPQLGGSLNWDAAIIGSQEGPDWARTNAEELRSTPGFTLLTSTTVTAAYEGNHFTLLQSVTDSRGVASEYLWKLKAEQVVLASGMIDRPLLFAGNDRPGIMLSSAVRRLIGEFAVAPADRLVIYTNNDTGYLTALSASRAGINVEAIVDTRDEQRSTCAAAAKRAGIECLFGSEVSATKGYRRLFGITVHDNRGQTRSIRCNGLAVAGGFTPLIHLASHRGVKPTYDATRGIFLANSLPAGWYSAGGVTGTLDLSTTLAQGSQCAQSIGVARGVPVRRISAETVEAGALEGGALPQRPKRGAASAMWVDFQNDVKASDIELAHRENYVSVEHLKRYTTLGMGTDQGRTSNVNGLAIMAELQGVTIDTVGTTTFRPPYTAVRMGAIANRRQGHLYRPRRYLPAHSLHESLSAEFDDFGWQRPDWYRSNGTDRESAVAAEMLAVRTHVGSVRRVFAR
jgi:sarcosine oxidase subunit alpha